MADYLLDSCVLIRHLRRHQPTMDLFAALVLEGNVGIATITRTEIIEGMRDHERERTLHLLNSLPTFPLDSAVPWSPAPGPIFRCRSWRSMRQCRNRLLGIGGGL